MSYAQLYTYDKKGLKQGEKLILALDKSEYSLTAAKSWREVSKIGKETTRVVFIAFGDNKGNIKIISKSLHVTKISSTIAKAHDMPITGIEFIKHCKTIDFK